MIPQLLYNFTLFIGLVFLCYLTSGQPALPMHSYPVGDYFEFTLKPPLEMTFTASSFFKYSEAGWNIRDSQNRKVVVQVDFPENLRKGIPGDYEIKYYAQVDNSGTNQIIGEKIRKATLLPADSCALHGSNCSPDARCVDLVHSYECRCNSGFQGNGLVCSDIDECQFGMDNCSSNADCINTHGSFKCNCKDGFKGDGYFCEDINECILGTHSCSLHADCINTIGSFQCVCRQGYTGNGETCVKVNKCVDGHKVCHPQASCETLDHNSYRCVCISGWRGDGHDCVDINECEENPFICGSHGTCINTPGGYQCICPSGYRRINNTCVEINECEENTHNCHPNAQCLNTRGSYDCKCNPGYFGDGFECTSNSVTPLFRLLGNNPMEIQQFSVYNEPGLEFTNDQTNIKFIVDIPRQLEGYVKECGEFRIEYFATFPDQPSQDEQERFPNAVSNQYPPRGTSQEQTRIVRVLPIDQCNLPPDSPFAADCHTYAQCKYIVEQCNYTCICPPGYEQNNDGRGINGCIDRTPPILVYHGPNPVMMQSCNLCGESLTESNLRDIQITKAYDTTPRNRIDISNRIMVEYLPSKVPDCLDHNYTVTDFAGNVASRKITVCSTGEDMQEVIENMKHAYSWQMFIIKSTGYLALIVLIVILLYLYGFILAAVFRVFIVSPLKRLIYGTQAGAISFEDYYTAYYIFFFLLAIPKAILNLDPVYLNSNSIRQRCYVSFHDADDENSNDLDGEDIDLFENYDEDSDDSYEDEYED